MYLKDSVRTALPEGLHKPLGSLALGMARISAHGLSAPVFQTAFSGLLNHVFRAPIARGDLGFLEERRLGVHIEDAAAKWTMTFSSGRLCVLPQSAVPEVIIRARFADFMLLAIRQIDADTLFFQRRLAIDGHVALGLAVKNFLDGMDIDEFPPALRMMLRAGEVLFGGSAQRQG